MPSNSPTPINGNAKSFPIGRAWLLARDGEIPLILDLCREMEGPFGILYVQLISRGGVGEGRYQNSSPVEYGVLAQFLNKFRAFIEQDGRLNLWVMSTSGEGQFIFDHHNMIYANGDLDRVQISLVAV